MARSRRSPRSGKKPNIKTDGASITISLEKGGIGGGITVGDGVLEVSLGIGIASVDYDLIEPYNSNVSYAFDLYEIDGERRGCEVLLRYKIGGVTVKTETRQIPECDEDKDEDEKRREEEGENADDLGPSGDEWSEDDFPDCAYVRWFQKWEALRTFKVELNEYGYERSVLQNRTEAGVDFKYEFFDNCGAPSSYSMEMSGPTLTANAEQYGNRINIINDRTVNGSPGWKPVELGDTWTRHDGSADFFADSLKHFVLYLNGKLSKNGYIGSHKLISAQFHQTTVPKRDENGNCLPIIKWQNRRVGRGGKYPPPTEKMDEKCCKLIKRMYKALAVDEVLDKKLKVPSRWSVPNGKGYVELDNYLSILNYQMRMQDHLGIHPFKALVTDVNAAKKGNQTAQVQTINATSATRQIMELLLENKGDSATRLNLQIRIAVAVGQVLSVVSIAAKHIEQVMGFLGMPRKEKRLKVPMPFDFTFGKGSKGFGRGGSAQPSAEAQDKLDKNDEKATEELLPKFMQDKEQPIIVDMLSDDDLTLLEAIQKINQ